ncbi:MAG: type II methionyl aminopeptidase [Candidatus Pacearchaeota archaeon]|nr:type II methionyl aminopeptidase [Candidatus Pacearchaeota archaeon]
MELDKSKILEAGKITSDVRAYARTIVKSGIPLLDISEKIEAKIIELGGKPAFPCNLSINEIAAHYTPSHDDKTLAHGLIKVDFGVHIDGYTADNSFSLDLDNSEENKKLISASEEALSNAIKLIENKFAKGKNVNNKSRPDDSNLKLSEIGSVIQTTIEKSGFSPIINLSGHSMEQYELHAGITIPNIDDKRNIKLSEGLYAIEPFATTGSGKIRDGRSSGIYNLEDTKKPRSPLAREVLEFIEKEYNTLPFCSRWVVKKFGTRALFALSELEANGNLHQFNQLVEVSGNKVSQAEHTILLEKDKVIVTTL